MSFMSISLALLLSTLFAFGWSANARKDSGDYWKGVMKDETMPKALEALILSTTNNNVDDVSPGKSTIFKKSTDCGEEHHATDSHGEDAQKLASVRDEFEPRPSLTAYVNKLDTMISTKTDEDEETKKPFLNGFEPRPNVSSYHDGDTTVVIVVEDQKPNMESGFEPRPNLSAYGG